MVKDRQAVEFLFEESIFFKPPSLMDINVTEYEGKDDDLLSDMDPSERTATEKLHRRLRSVSDVNRPTWETPAEKSLSDSSVTYKKRNVRTIRKSTVNSGTNIGKIINILNEQKVPDSIKIEPNENGVKMVQEGTIKDLCKLVSMEREFQSNFVDVFLCTFRYFTTPKDVFQELLRAHRETCISSTDQMQELGQETITEWNEGVERHIMKVIQKWCSIYYNDFATDPELERNLFDFLSSDIFENNTKVNLDKVVMKVEECQETYKVDNDNISKQENSELDISPADSLNNVDGRHCSILELTAMELTMALCTIDSELFMRIPCWEFTSLGWASKNKTHLVPNLLKSIAFFNDVSNWVATEIVLTANLSMRVSVIERFITIAKQCKEWHNYNTCFEIVLGLNNPAVIRLKDTWSKVSRKYMSVLRDLNNLLDPTKNHKNYRQVIQKAPVPCVPYLGLYLKDIFFAMDGSSTFLSNGNVNFSKMNTIGEALLSIRNFQSQGYNFHQSKAVAWITKNMIVLPLNQLMTLSKKLTESVDF